MVGKKKVSFWSYKEIKKPTKVSFVTNDGERIIFKANKTIRKPIKVTFYVKRKRK